MTSLLANIYDNRFPSIYQSMDEACVEVQNGNPLAVLQWYHQMNGQRVFQNLRPYQIINRIPKMIILTRKVPEVYGVNRLISIFPEAAKYFPRSYVLPLQDEEFASEVAKQETTFIVKPDGGSYGRGIVIIKPGQTYTAPHYLAVGQEYIESFLIDNTKFDLRIYVLIASLTPLRCYVYHDGLARFCARKSGGTSKFSQITNVKLNMEAPGVEIEKISRILSETFERLKEMGVDTDVLWDQIDDAIALTVISAYGDLVRGEQRKCRAIYGYSRCFQMLGFDILLDLQGKPNVLEVNYRPSLSYYRGKERRMKSRMLADCIRIAAPARAAQAAVLAKKYGWTDEEWGTFLQTNPDIFTEMKKERKAALAESKFKKVIPSKTHPEYKRLCKQMVALPENAVIRKSRAKLRSMGEDISLEDDDDDDV